MAVRKNEMRNALIAERDALFRQREALDNEIKGLERAIALVESDNPAKLAGTGKRTSNKATVLKLLEEAGTSGLNATSAVELADKRGLTLDRSSVASLLSRLKADNVVAYDGDRYRLLRFVARESAPENVLNFANR